MKTLSCGAGLLVLMVCAVAVAADPPATAAAAKAPEAVVYDAQSAFAFLSTMGGEWSRGRDDHEHGGTSRTVISKVSAGGSSVIETLYPNEPNEMVTVFHMNGKELLLTHYCALGNAPVMKFEKSDKPGEMRFAFEGGTNFDVKLDQHVHQGVLQIESPTRVQATFTTWDRGRPLPASTTIMIRKPAKSESAAAGH